MGRPSPSSPSQIVFEEPIWGRSQIISPGKDEDEEGGSSESDVEEHLVVERRLDHDLIIFEMIYRSNDVYLLMLNERVFIANCSVLRKGDCQENMAMEVTQILLNAQSVDGSVRNHAEESLKQFQEQNLAGFLLSLSGELASEEKPVDSRKLSGLVLKNALDAKEEHRKFELVQRWLSLDVGAKTQIKACLLQTLSSPVYVARSTASQVIAKIAGIELPQKQWPELIGSLLSKFTKFRFMSSKPLKKHLDICVKKCLQKLLNKIM
ncbi:hypothetical protein L1987_15376 [Smallanthus sonchifolius]|uniref:Uncharacterized protein n=1 Tax=Smallanthus sonchifolius TaxID=185202 RepID=A0ACB9J8W0_9ASTR|nr:hypothetical protein L1987_15376 [Smallanthus sonchifolius]